MQRQKPLLDVAGSQSQPTNTTGTATSRHSLCQGTKSSDSNGHVISSFLKSFYQADPKESSTFRLCPRFQTFMYSNFELSILESGCKQIVGKILPGSVLAVGYG
jgi:hypothetical protein